ncbi:MAG: glycoside hydrolase family 13 protein [Lachnospiraceae bacterium]|nr:glycoside hydrolase family 13 protein [Lachnospiraceae bacterium]
MIQQGIRHTGTFPDIYARSRKELVVSLRVAKKEVVECELLYFSRDRKEEVHTIPMKFRYRDALYDYYICSIKLSKVARYQKYYFLIQGNDGSVLYLTATGMYEKQPTKGFFEYLYVNETDVIEVPYWARGTLYYQIFPERFAGDAGKQEGFEPWGTMPTRENYMGGNIRGITQHLEHLHRLGVECIYLNPIFEAKFNHKYATTDYKKIDPLFGTEKDFKELISKAHSFNIKVLLDGVFNHTGTDFFAFQDILRNQEESEYVDWYYITKFPVEISHKNYECVGAYKHMPKLRSGNPKVRDYILGIMEYWIDHYHIDGWRLDVADEVDPEVWNEARARLKEKNKDLLLLGETWGDGLALMNGGRMDSIMNYVFRDATLEFVADESIDAVAYSERLQAMLAHYPEEMNQCMYLVLDSHDTERCSFRCKENRRKQRVAITLQMLFEGAPAIYYGDEIGMTGDNDPDCRRCMLWDRSMWDQQLLELYYRLGVIRHRYTCVKTGELLVNVSEGRTFGFIRYDANGEIVVLVNSGEKEITVTVPVLQKKDYLELETSKSYVAAAWDHKSGCNGDVHHYQGQIQVTMGAYETKILGGDSYEKEKNIGNCTRSNA